MTYFEKLEQAAARNRSRLCVGLDPDPERIPHGEIGRYLREIIAATRDVVCCYKPNLAFFEALGPDGIALLREVQNAIPRDVPILADAKRGDIGNTAEAYARAIFDTWQFDATTVNAYGGRDTLEPFLAYADRGVYVWCRSSNPGAGDFQDLQVTDQSGEQRPLYEVVAARIEQWNVNKNAALVAGATFPEQIGRLRSLCPDLPFLLPGVGAQGAALRDAVHAASFTTGGGFIVNASRGVLYASAGPDFAEAARREAITLRDAIADAERATVAG